ncbi:UNVERIFIED_CONTAM: hypothetical protein Sindi_2652300 [Sesamum indicum]
MEMEPESADMGADAVADVTADMRHDTSADIIADMGHDTGAEVIADRRHDTDADASDDVSKKVEKNRFFAPKIASTSTGLSVDTTTYSIANRTSTGLFIGNIPLHACGNSEVDDKIAQVFNNSSRKMLSYIAPIMQNGEVVVRPSLDTVRDGAKRWKTTAVGYFLGKLPYFHHLKEYAQSVWPALRETLRKNIIIMTSNEDGGETPCKIDVEYEWLPPKCTSCMTIGHMTKDCELNKPLKPTETPVAVYIPKVNVSQPPPATEKNRKASNIDSTGVGASRKAEDDKHKKHNPDKHNDRVVWNVRGLNKRDHQLALKDLVSEYRLHFLGILETRVRITNVMHIQSFLLPQWKWFVDYASVGNRIWIAWDDNLLDVHILDLGEQFIHCRITIKALHESCIITIAYGASEVIDKRTLWHTSGTLAPQCSNDPWLVRGDFNAVRDLNEVCGISGDIRIATEEFNAGIQEAGLLPLPMQGEWYTWHNCSTTARSLWKRLDRILINDRWLARFPTHHIIVFYPGHLTTRRLSFMGIHRNIMEHEVIGVPMYAVTRKLKALKQVFRQQRRNKGDLTRNVQLAKGFLDEAQTLVSSDRQNELFLYLEHFCRMVYAKAAKTEQIMIQQRAKMQWMKDGDQCSRVFFRKIAQRRAMRRILQINDEHGTTHTDPGEVVHEFVSFYQNLLGGNRCRTLVDINYLRPWARHILSDEEANHLLSPFSPEEVKLAVFDIAEDKAPGPDGYSSGFYKAAWPVVGAEVTRAVLDFFSTGRLLKQVNSTLLDLIPKVHTPMSCEPAKVFQLGFADDLLLFCRADLDSVRVLKVGLDRFAEWSGLRLNIQKSHIIISWSAQERKDQLLSILGFQEGHLPMRYLGLPLISSRLTISDCQPLLSKIDARIAGWEALSIYWASAFILPKSIIKEVEKRLRRFLWKGTSMTGYAKVAWKDVCKPIGEGGQGIKDIDALNRALMTKKLCDIIRCDRTSTWVEWLQHGRLQNNSTWTVDEKGGSWGWRKLLRLRSLIQPMVECRIGDGRTFYLWKDPWYCLYWSSAFILPKKVTNEIEKRLRTFLWKGTTNSGYAKVAWKDLCRLKDEGGIGFKDIAILNRTLMTKKLCDIIRCDRTSIWVEWLYQGRLRDTSIWTIRENGGSWGWRKILRLRAFLRPMVDYQIGDGRTFYLWQDPWHYLGPLSVTFPRGPRLLRIEESARLSTVISEGEWQWPPITDFECLEITHGLPTIHGGEDRIIWRFDQGKPTTQALYRLFDPPGPKVGWASLLSGSLKIPRHLFIMWLAILGKLATTNKSWLAHLGPCILCNEGATETHGHLFFQCRFSKHIVNISYRALLASCVYHIWRETNLRRFEHTERTPSTMALLIVEDIKQRILSISLPRLVSTRALYRLWHIPWPGQWHLPLITDLECLQIIYTLPQIHDGDDRIIWRFPDGRPTAQALYKLICPPGPKVGWTSLLSGSKNYQQQTNLGSHTLEGVFYVMKKQPRCIITYSSDADSVEDALLAIREIIRFAWPNRTWAMDVEWAVRKWRGKHIINAAYRALLGSFIYHLWRERNSRRFQQIEHPPNVLASLIINDVRQRILSLNLSSKISTCALYRLWCIPWPVEYPINCCTVPYFSLMKFTITEKKKQVNSTILALIPKRLSVLLEKVISPCQTAFIPKRSIGDNIMLAQELFSGYNQMRLPPRCALKVDIMKADTVEWDFLLAVLQLFGFPPKFTRWIEECVSTTSFSIGLIGIPHGFFTGARGL